MLSVANSPSRCMFKTPEKSSCVPWATEIIPSLFLGSMDDASDFSSLCSHGVTHIVNVADNVPNYFEGQFVYQNLNVRDDGEDEGISRVFSAAMGFIDAAIQSGNRVLVHCAAGKNRSATIVIAYLMIMRRMSLAQSFDYVKSLRSITMIFVDNRRHLQDLESSLFGQTSMRSIDFQPRKLMLQ